MNKIYCKYYIIFLGVGYPVTDLNVSSSSIELPGFLVNYIYIYIYIGINIKTRWQQCELSVIATYKSAEHFKIFFRTWRFVFCFIFIYLIASFRFGNTNILPPPSSNGLLGGWVSGIGQGNFLSLGWETVLEGG